MLYSPPLPLHTPSVVVLKFEPFQPCHSVWTDGLSVLRLLATLWWEIIDVTEFCTKHLEFLDNAYYDFGHPLPFPPLSLAGRCLVLSEINQILNGLLLYSDVHVI